MSGPLTERERAALAAASHGRRPPAALPPSVLVQPMPTRPAALAAPEPAPVPADPTVVDAIDTLIRDGAKSPVRSTRVAAARVAAAIDDLRTRLAGEAEITAAEAKVADLRAQLDQAIAEAKAARKSATTTEATSARPDPKVVRAWAAANDVDCPAHGVVPTRVVDAWRTATGGAA